MTTMKTIKNVLAVAVLVVIAVMVWRSCGEAEEVERVELKTIEPTDTVYVCTGRSAQRYHIIDHCAGLSGCSRAVDGLTRAEAEAKHKSPCNICIRWEE